MVNSVVNDSYNPKNESRNVFLIEHRQFRPLIREVPIFVPLLQSLGLYWVLQRFCYKNFVTKVGIEEICYFSGYMNEYYSVSVLYKNNTIKSSFILQTGILIATSLNT